MKKRKNKKLRKIGIVVLITAVLLSLLAVLVYADEETSPTHESCVAEHFTWVQNDSDEDGDGDEFDIRLLDIENDD